MLLDLTFPIINRLFQYSCSHIVTCPSGKMYGAQNEGDGRGMVEKWWKRLEFSELGGRRGDGCAKRLVYIGLIWV